MVFVIVDAADWPRLDGWDGLRIPDGLACTPVPRRLLPMTGVLCGWARADHYSSALGVRGSSAEPRPPVDNSYDDISRSGPERGDPLVGFGSVKPA